MSRQPSVHELVERNKILAIGHKPWPLMAQAFAGGMPPTLIIACLDPRSEPKDIFGLKQGEAAVIRNVGGRLAHAIEEILALDKLLNFDNMVVVHHTDCGMTYVTNDDIRNDLKHDHGDMSAEIDALVLPSISDPVQSARDDLEFFKGSALVRKELRDRAMGYVYDIKTGELSSV